MRQPPGAKRRTSPHSASNAPSINTDERIAHARCAGISVREGAPDTVTFLPSRTAETPSARRTSIISSTSLISGQSRTVTGLCVSTLAASIGSTAFLAP